MILQRLFLEHPRTVGEGYLEHQRQAFGFGASMMLAGFACLLHGLCPALFVSTGSRTISRLYERMVAHRRVALPRDASPAH
ncbi:MAG TPA: DUF6356 family protein [Steroidobacteraceae bacterium]|nr:DUF6356 family protein [Steroidobacteraceae bacterium]